MYTCGCFASHIKARANARAKQEESLLNLSLPDTAEIRPLTPSDVVSSRAVTPPRKGTDSPTPSGASAANYNNSTRGREEKRQNYYGHNKSSSNHRSHSPHYNKAYQPNPNYGPNAAESSSPRKRAQEARGLFPNAEQREQEEYERQLNGLSQALSPKPTKSPGRRDRDRLKTDAENLLNKTRPVLGIQLLPRSRQDSLISLISLSLIS